MSRHAQRRFSLITSGLCLAALTVLAAWAAPPESTTSPTQDRQPADLVLRNGKIVTVDEELGTVTTLAARGGRIVAAGSDADVAAHIGEATKVIDLDGRLAIPGFIEGHGHFTGLGEAKMNLDLMNVSSWQEVILMVVEAVKNAKPGEWIVGRGWHQEKWDRPPDDTVEGFPTHWSLSKVSPDNPVSLTHASGHASFANKKAMDMSGISASTADPPGGEILRDESGQPIGIFRETAQGLIRSGAGTTVSPRQRAERMDRAIDLAVRECLSKGVTSFQDAGSGFYVIDKLAERARAGSLGVRLWVMIRTGNNQLREYTPQYAKLKGVGDHHLTVGGIKRSLDGALGARGAWLLEPYSDSAQSVGLALMPIEELDETAQIALSSGLQLCVHAIGDRANREVLDCFERAVADSPKDLGDLRWRVEHAQHIHPDDIPRFGKLGVIASMQGVHCTSDGPWVYARLGRERAKSGAYMWQTLMQTGAVVTNGTDAPVEDVDPIASFYATVSRRLKDGSPFFPDQAMSRMEALRSYTSNAAYAAKEEDIKGTLTPGKLADIVVLSKDIMTVPQREIRDARVDLTIVGGAVAYERETDN